MGVKQGILKMHAVTATLFWSDVGMLQRMSPQVIIRINEQEWRNEPAFNQGERPMWGEMMRMEHIVADPMREVHIVVRDKDMMGGEIIGESRLPLNFFLKPMMGPMNEWIELKRFGMDAGRIHMRSDFNEQMMGAAGMPGTTTTVTII